MIIYLKNSYENASLSKHMVYVCGSSNFLQSTDTVLAEISCAKISKDLSLEKACLFGCGVSTGLGAVWNTCKVEVDSSVAVFGLGAVGLAVIQGAKMAGASRIIAVDINESKFPAAIALGATDTVDSSKLDKPVQSHIVGMTKWGVDVRKVSIDLSLMRIFLYRIHPTWYLLFLLL